MTQRKFPSLARAVEAYFEDLRAFIRHRTGSDSVADDVVQDTWLRACTSTVAMPQNAKAYVFRMAGNVAVDHLKRETARSDREAESTAGWIASDGPTPEEQAAARQELAILVAAVWELPPKRRRIFVLYRGHGLTMRQIAEKLGISEKTVEKQIARAMVHCRVRLRDAGHEI